MARHLHGEVCGLDIRVHAFQKKTQKTRREDVELAARRYRQIGNRLMNTETEPIVESGGNVFADLGFSEEEATLLKLRADLMASLRQTIEARNWTQAQAAAEFGISQPRVSDLMRGKWDKFSLDMLLALVVRAGLLPRIELEAA